MQIGNYYENYTKTGTGMSAYDAIQSGNVSTHNVSVKGMPQGSVFEGNVAKIKGNQVLLVLENGQSIKARLDGSVKLSLGQSMFFQVKSNENGVVSIKPYTDGVHSNPTLLKALLAAGLMTDENNLEMVNTMIKEKMPIDKDNLILMHKNILNAQGVDSETVVKLVKMNIPVTKENAATLSAYVNGNHEVIDQTKAVLSGVYDLISSVPDDSKLLAGVNASIIANLLGDEEASDGIMVSSKALESEGAVAKAEGDIAEEALISKGGAIFGTDSEELQNSDASVRSKTQYSFVNGEEITPLENLKTELKDGSVSLLGGGLDTEEGIALKEEIIKQEYEVIISSGKGEYKPNELGAILSDKQLEHFADMLKNLGNLGDNEALFDDSGNVNKNLTVKQALEMISLELAANPDKISSSDIKRLFSSNSYRSMLESVLENEWSVLPEKTNAKSLSDLFNKISKQLLNFENIVKESGIEAKTLTDSAGALKDNLNFLNDLNHAYNYIQIPLSLGNQTANGELFVYTNKKSLNDGDGSLSAALHLDMGHLGMTDVFIKMTGKTLDTKFTIADDISFKLIERYLPVLKTKLDKLGFNTTLNLEKSEEERKSFLSELLMQEQGSSSEMVHRYSFDVRT